MLIEEPALLVLFVLLPYGAHRGGLENLPLSDLLPSHRVTLPLKASICFKRRFR